MRAPHDRNISRPTCIREGKALFTVASWSMRASIDYLAKLTADKTWSPDAVEDWSPKPAGRRVKLIVASVDVEIGS